MTVPSSARAAISVAARALEPLDAILKKPAIRVQGDYLLGIKGLPLHAIAVVARENELGGITRSGGRMAECKSGL